MQLLMMTQFVTNWLTIVLGERESEGIDFWWLDWQQGIMSQLDTMCM